MNLGKAERREAETDKEKAEVSEEKASRLFPEARIFGEGTFQSATGDQVMTLYVDLSGQVGTGAGLCLVKATEPQYEPEKIGSIRLSRPPAFQQAAEEMIQDDQEGRVRIATREHEDVPVEGAELVDERVAALNASLQLGEMKMSVKGTRRERRSNTSESAVTFGRDLLVYSTSTRPSADEMAAWRNSLPAKYTSVTPIHRPRPFAQGLGLGVCEYIGVRGDARPVRNTLKGFGTVEEMRRTQIVVHGPMVYVNNPYALVAEAAPGWEKFAAMIFLKSREGDYAGQKEYRFALLSVGPEVGEVFDMPLSGMLRDCLTPLARPGQLAPGEGVVLSPDESPPPKERRTSGEHTYRRRFTRRESSSWSGDGPKPGRMKEEVVEDTVTSADELSEPFPTADERQPDVVVIQEWEGKLRWVHHAYRDEETKHFRLETLREEATDGVAPRTAPAGLSVPETLQYEQLARHPVDPRLVLQMCLNPSVPKPPMPYGGLSRLDKTEFAHLLACGESVRMAVDLLEGEERGKAAASAWYAQRFILDVVTRFGPVVKTVCVIRPGVAVVELVPAPLSGAAGWATFSGTRTYTLYVSCGQIEEYVFPGGSSREGVMRAKAYADVMERHGWVPKRVDRRRGKRRDTA